MVTKSFKVTSTDAIPLGIVVDVYEQVEGEQVPKLISSKLLETQDSGVDLAIEENQFAVIKQQFVG